MGKSDEVGFTTTAGLESDHSMCETVEERHNAKVLDQIQVIAADPVCIFFLS